MRVCMQASWKRQGSLPPFTWLAGAARSGLLKPAMCASQLGPCTGPGYLCTPPSTPARAAAARPSAHKSLTPIPAAVYATEYSTIHAYHLTQASDRALTAARAPTRGLQCGKLTNLTLYSMVFLPVPYYQLNRSQILRLASLLMQRLCEHSEGRVA